MQVHQKQVEFFRQIGKKITSHALLAEEIAQALDISKSEAYNKISGKSQVTITQVETLCNKYHVSFEINAPTDLNGCYVKFSSFHSGAADISKYLESLNNLMHMLAASGVRKISCATDDIPFFPCLNTLS